MRWILHSLASVTPPPEMAKVASFSGISGLKGITHRWIRTNHPTHESSRIETSRAPVKDLGDPHLSAALPQADAGGGGVGQDVAADRLLGIRLKSEKQKKQKLV